MVREVGIADGVQCNGLPSYSRYAPLNRAPLLYLDSRVRSELLIEDAELRASNDRRHSGRPLHLVYSGRLIKAKGADQLVEVAGVLRRRRVPFQMTICGDGELRPQLVEEVRRAGLVGSVHFAGVLDFESELLPFIKREADLFVCCHPQGDPSCTYLETFACGVPIVGYGNEALRALLPHCEAGACVPRGGAEALAGLIEQLSSARETLCAWSHSARAFAARHTMEVTFGRRIGHLRSVRNDFSARGPKALCSAAAQTARPI